MDIKVWLVNDCLILRKGLKVILEKEIDMEVSGEAANSSELFTMLEKDQPDIIVMDLILDHTAVISLTKKVHHEYPLIPILILTIYGHENTALECIINGVNGIIGKENTPEELLQAIRTVASGETYFAGSDSNILALVFQYARSLREDSLMMPELSQREKEVLVLIAKGNSCKQIGQVLNISSRTVESHKNKVLSKLQLHSITDLTKFAIKNNLIKL